MLCKLLNGGYGYSCSPHRICWHQTEVKCWLHPRSWCPCCFSPALLPAAQRRSFHSDCPALVTPWRSWPPSSSCNCQLHTRWHSGTALITLGSWFIRASLSHIFYDTMAQFPNLLSSFGDARIPSFVLTSHILGDAGTCNTTWWKLMRT